VLAARIVADRERNGPFRRVDDLERVSGIGPTLLARLRPLVTV
jgi:competence protein ComEA